MSLTTLPTRGTSDLGTALTNIRTPEANELSAVNVEAIKDRIIQIGTDLGVDATPAAGSVKARLDDLEAAVPLLADGSVPFGGDFDADGNTLSGLATPSADSDAATKAYVDTLRPVIEADASNTRNMADTDHGRIIIATDAGDLEITVPTGLTPGTTAEFVHGAGAVTVVAGGGMTLLYPATFLPNTNEANSSLVVTILTSTSALVRGDLEAA